MLRRRVRHDARAKGAFSLGVAQRTTAMSAPRRALTRLAVTVALPIHEGHRCRLAPIARQHTAGRNNQRAL